MKALSYEEWAQGKNREFGQHAIITDKLARAGFEWHKSMSELLAHSFSRVLLDNGLAPREATMMFERDAALQGTQIAMSIIGEKEPSCLPYVAVAYQAWLESNIALEKWEHTSLWGYLKFWFKRTFGGKVE